MDILIFILVTAVIVIALSGIAASDKTDTAKERYKKDLQDDRWKNKRQKILKRDNYQCIRCGYQHKLQVHHTYYERYPNNHSVKPWDYPDTALITLCDNCHKKEHETRKIKSYHRKFGVHY